MILHIAAPAMGPAGRACLPLALRSLPILLVSSRRCPFLRFRFLVALAPVRDLLLCAKHLFVAAILAGPPASHPISQGTGHHRADGPRQARSQGDVPLVAATPVQDLRFRANDLRADAKLTARWLRTTGMAARPGELRQVAIHSPARGARRDC